MANPPAASAPALLGACAALLLAGVVGLAVVDPDDGEPSAISFDEPTSSTTAPADVGTLPPLATTPGQAGATTPPAPAGVGTPATTSAPVPSPTATTAPAGPATTATTAAAAPGSPPGPLTPPAVGTYAYDARTTEAGKEPTTQRLTTTVEAAGTEGAATVQEITITTEGPQGPITVRSNVAWSTSAGAIVRRSRITAGGQQLDCTWQPAYPLYVGALRVGAAWSFDTTCTATTTFGPVTIRQQGARKVVGQKPDAVPGGGSTPTWTVEEDSTQTLSFGGTTATTRTTGTEQLAPSLGVPTSGTRRTTSTADGASTTRDVESRLVGKP